MAVAVETRISHSVARVSAAPAAAPMSLSRQVRDNEHLIAGFERRTDGNEHAITGIERQTAGNECQISENEQSNMDLCYRRSGIPTNSV